MTRFIALPDMQIPYHDKAFIDALMVMVDETQPDALLIVGDELDAPEPSRWNKGFAGEYAPTLQRSINECYEILRDFRGIMGAKPIHLMRSNHGERIQKYISKYAPALASLDSLKYEELLSLSSINITYHAQPYEFAPGFVLAHGDEGGSSQVAGGTALGLARKWNRSVVAGHTHKAGLVHQHAYLNGKPSSLLYGVEVGHAMDMKKAGYLASGSANWQQAFAVIDVDGKHAIPDLRIVRNKSFILDGKQYKW